MIKVIAMDFISLSSNYHGSQRGSLPIQRQKLYQMLSEDCENQDET